VHRIVPTDSRFGATLFETSKTMAASKHEDQSGGTFEDLGLRPELISALAGLGYEEPTPIQREAIPRLLEGRDLVGQAGTGTGKTAAFALPILERLAVRGQKKQPLALVLVPTRELAMQVSEAMHRYGRALGARILPVYGGQPIVRQLRELKAGVDVVVATPGRALDHLNRGTLPLEGLEVVVLDEADEMLDMGFAEDIDALLANVPENRQTVLFSATMPPRIAGLARRHLHDPIRIQLESAPLAPGEEPLVRQVAYVVARAHKLSALGRVLDVEGPTAALVFCRTRGEVDTLTEALSGRGYRAEALHGGMSQEQRERVMGRLRSGRAELLIATDVAARGLDIDSLTHVINYDVPSAPEAYVHRIGRVGRAGREGVAITLAEPREHRMLRNIEAATRRRIPIEKLPTVADLRTRRLELTSALIRETILSEDLATVRVIVEALSDEFDIMEVALAAVKLVAAANAGLGVEEEAEIPEAKEVREDRAGSGKWKKTGQGGDAGPGARGGARRGGSREGTTRIYIGAGRAAGIRPQDVVGAIANETGLSGRDIGAIEIADRFTLVEIPEGSADGVVEALRATTIKGKRTTVRRERDAS